MKRFYIWLFSCVSILGFAQDRPIKGTPGASDNKAPVIEAKATIDQYRIITLQRDTTYVDTSLTIRDEYNFNYLRRDIFGLQPFSNEGQTYNLLHFGLRRFGMFPNIGYKAKHYNYLEADQIRYYSVATPFTDLYFKSVMKQGQNLDAFITMNTSENFNFSLAYKGLRSLGKYINQLSSSGNFRFTSSYNTPNKRYFANFHFVSQDILNGENGGIASTDDFESEDADFKNRARLEVFLKDAESFLKGKRFFLDHHFRINKESGSNNLYVGHQFNFETKFFEFAQPTVASTITASDGTVTVFNRFGDSYVTSGIHDQVRYNRMYNMASVTYENSLLGKFRFFAEDFRYNYYFNNILILDNGVIPGSLNDEINTIGGQYHYRKDKWNGSIQYTNAIVGPPASNLEASIKFAFNDRNSVSFHYQNANKLPDHIFNLHQSSYVAYNWYNDFKNEKINSIEVNANTQWATATVQFRTLNDYLFFSVDADETSLLVSPKQYDQTINYMSVKIGREFRLGKFALDNTILYQQATQDANVLNVPDFVTRNTLYYSNYFFKKALYLQTGVTLNYFTEYYADDYNPLLGEFYVQEQKKIGNFPMLDFFINARVRQTRIYLKAEHFNSAMTGNNFYSSPTQPYRDFLIRFGLEWNFFK